ncbi:phytanoyl-CoA dioxygenase family protein [Stenotrophobium rhamnosiphilum]|uniref:Phytanoyl-CoA dioxygenase n=1 Tax=Stenotrophobium rhamnosiphilum TaxID=2029166 RepID=A0A2T5MIE7_9GAMM|nr:phytanoyl-CoA dioxygenase family protein [Stenotrophobium rhamnosiphilum]PTU32366.1 hypothetical protein CJD38_06875 [Stenotrophobium rhamnosiphilum]
MSLSSKMRHLRLVWRDFRWWRFYLQRSVIGPVSRRAVTRLMARFRPPHALKAEISPNVGQALQALLTSGLVRLRDMLSAEDCDALMEYFLRHEVRDAYRPENGSFLPDSERRHPLSHVAHHQARDIVLAPRLLAVANDPEILDIAGRYLGCKPTLAYLAVWWSYPTEIGAQQAENFHRDVDDWRFLKLFVCLSDVGPDNGPHKYVTNSVESEKLREIRRFTDQEVESVFGIENIKCLTGHPGQAFLEDTFGIHKGQPVKQGRRLMFQAVYSMYSLPYGPGKPVATLRELGEYAPGIKVDPWINRFYFCQ